MTHDEMMAFTEYADLWNQHQRLLKQLETADMEQPSRYGLMFDSGWQSALEHIREVLASPAPATRGEEGR